jgi:hypothetical protein
LEIVSTAKVRKQQIRSTAIKKKLEHFVAYISPKALEPDRNVISHVFQVVRSGQSSSLGLTVCARLLGTAFKRTDPARIQSMTGGTFVCDFSPR